MGKVARSWSSSSSSLLLLFFLSLLLLLLPLILVPHVCSGFQPPQQRLLQRQRRSSPEAKKKSGRFFTTTSSSSSRSRLYLSNKPPVKEKNAKVVVKGKEAVNGSFSSSSSVGTPSSSSSSQSWLQIDLPYYLQSEAYHLIPPALVGVLVGVAVAIFKLSVEGLREFSYGNYPLPSNPELLLLIPTFGGLAVGLFRMLGVLPPGLRETIEQVDQQEADRLPMGDFWQRQADFFRKSFSSVLTLGTGNSLGPEGPSVELGVNVAKVVLQLVPDLPTSTGAFPMEQKRRLLLSCGAAAGVSAGFNAPIAGVFFALEIVQGAFQFLDTKNARLTEYSATAPGTICAVLLSSVLSALVSREILGSTMVLKVSSYALNTPALELPIFLFLGVLSGITAFVFSRAANFSQYCFNKGIFKDVPRVLKPALGGLFCGTVGLVFPQVLFFGYETLNRILAAGTLSTELVLSLLVMKLITTAVAAGSGLVGGTFAPSLFLGAMLGASLHDLLIPFFGAVPPLDITGGPVLDLADVQAYALVGAGSVLAALFRAPLTASLLLFELTRDYDFILPLMASAGVGSVVADLLDKTQEKQGIKKRRDDDSVSWGDLSLRSNETVVEVMEEAVVATSAGPTKKKD